MSKYKIAEIITEANLKNSEVIHFFDKFKYNGEEPAQIKLAVSDKHLHTLLSKMVEGTTPAQAESFSLSSAFNRAIISYGAMLVHSSAIIYKGRAYLFSAESGVGKSTHTRLWKQAFGDEVTYINDDKPVVRIGEDNSLTVYGTPFDGGSEIAENISAPLGAIVFIERGEQNSIREAEQSEAIKNLYISTVKSVDEQTAFSMLSNIEKIILNTDIYVLTCNMDIQAACLARDTIVK